MPESDWWNQTLSVISHPTEEMQVHDDMTNNPEEFDIYLFGLLGILTRTKTPTMNPNRRDEN